MMETVEQQKAKSSPNIETDHAADTEATPAASEEDDFEDEHEQLETAQKNITENGRAAEESTPETQADDYMDKLDNSPPSMHRTKNEAKDDQELSVAELPALNNNEVSKTVAMNSDIAMDSPVSRYYVESSQEEDDEVDHDTLPMLSRKSPTVMQTPEDVIKIEDDDDEEVQEANVEQQLNEDNLKDKELTSPVFKIDDLSPDSIPDGDVSSSDLDVSHTTPNHAVLDVIKIESDSDMELESKTKLEVEPPVKIKINGAHRKVLVPLTPSPLPQDDKELPLAKEDKQLELADQVDTKTRPLQMSVIAKNADEHKEQSIQQEREHLMQHEEKQETDNLMQHKEERENEHFIKLEDEENEDLTEPEEEHENEHLLQHEEQESQETMLQEEEQEKEENTSFEEEQENEETMSQEEDQENEENTSLEEEQENEEDMSQDEEQENEEIMSQEGQQEAEETMSQAEEKEQNVTLDAEQENEEDMSQDEEQENEENMSQDEEQETEETMSQAEEKEKEENTSLEEEQENEEDMSQEDEPEKEQPLLLLEDYSRSSSASSESQQLVIDQADSVQPLNAEEMKEQQTEQAEHLQLHAIKRGRSSDNDTNPPTKQICTEERTELQVQEAEPTARDPEQRGLQSEQVSLESDKRQSMSLLLQRLQAPALGAIPAEPMPATATSSAVVAHPPTPLEQRYYRCARCTTVHQHWNFFLHMRDVHQRYICLYCSQVYAGVEKLSLHLENKHDMDQRHFNNVDAWSSLRGQEDRNRLLVCCNCQATFKEGAQFVEHDCAEFMQPCALCGLKNSHDQDCRNSNSRASAKKLQLASRRKRKQAKSNEQQMEQQAAPTLDIPVTSSEAAMPSPPKLVVPKIMLRVPKEFQKSVDAALSSTDSEEEELDESPTAGFDAEAASSLTVDAVQQLQPMSMQSEDTETATETASMNLEAVHNPTLEPEADNEAEEEQEDMTEAENRLKHILEEFERTKLDIERTRAHMSKKEPQVEQQLQLEQPMQQPAQQQPPQPQPRWSPTPPASPHNNHISMETHLPKVLLPPPLPTEQPPSRRDSLGSECMDIDESIAEQQQQQEGQPVMPVTPSPPPAAPAPPADGIVVASDETHTLELLLDRPLDKFELVDFVRLCLKQVYHYCLFCNHARRIAVNAQQLVLHLISQHRFTATVDSITAEELQAETIVAKLKSYLPELEAGKHYLNAVSCCSLEPERFAQTYNERIYECFQCRFVTATHKELYTHNRRLHIKSNISCHMCRLNFFSYSELLCHICPGQPNCDIFDVNYRCCLCDVAPLPSAFRLMVHLRKQHQACDICLEDCHSQAKLSSHVWKHKLLHLCYRCGIAYRNKQDISKHLFWKHGTESASCKRCLQKRWRHVYHFCVPAAQFTCEQCQFSFSKAIYLEVHKREHEGDFRYACAEEECVEKFVSRKLLLKHMAAQHEHKQEQLSQSESPQLEEQSDEQLEQLKQESATPQTLPDEDTAEEQSQSDTPAEPTEQLKSPKLEPTDSNLEAPAPATAELPQSNPRKRRKKSKRQKASLEDLNLIAPNLSETDSSDDSDSDVAASTAPLESESLPMRSTVDDLHMPRVMLSPASESDGEEPKKLPATPPPQKEHKAESKEEEQQDKLQQLDLELETAKKELEIKLEEHQQKQSSADEDVPDIWKNLLDLHAQQLPSSKTESNLDEEEHEELLTEQRRPSKLHIAYSDHDYCKMQRTPPPTVSPTRRSPKKHAIGTPKSAKRTRNDSSSDSSSSSSSNSDSDSSSCSCGSNCSCSSSGSSSSDEDSDNAATKPAKRSEEAAANSEEYVNVTSLNEEELPPVLDAPAPAPAPIYNESDFDTNVSDTDEEFYDAHPQKLASEMFAQKRLALLAEQATQQPGSSNNYDIVENSRPSTPSLPEEANAFAADKRERAGRSKKKKRERKSSCKAASNQSKLPQLVAPPPQQPLSHTLIANDTSLLGLMPTTPLPLHQQQPFHLHHQQQLQQQQQQQLLPETPLTHHTPGHQLARWQPRISEGSSCSDADGQLKRSKRQRRPNKFYGYTSDDENMSSVLAPPLQVGMQLIRPQPPPQLTWAKEDLPTPAKSHGHSHLHSNGNSSGGGASRKRKRPPLSGVGAAAGSVKRAAKRSRKQLPPPVVKPTPIELPPIPTLKIRPSLLPTSAANSDSSLSSSEEEDEDDDEQLEVNVTSLLPMTTSPLVQQTPSLLLPTPILPPPAPVPPPPATPATTAFNQPIPPALLPNPDFATLQYFKANNIRYPIRPPAGARLAREGESVYCYCRCPYDEVSEMIACDGDNCLIEWFHFECVGIMVAPQGKWFCAECRPKYSEGLYVGAKPN
ncbi:MESR4 [Drosophila busckii]|uniref:MESR4 n=1 Tax=Drosophila busckii TaxID=30019 RepID=A0A0M4EFN0_DROBS|nr:uncharacterized protein LOC108596641 [Drosophila busckii]XP_017838094.1 uncharacterized protein LOC108596641 [Drosophila busckii]XP_017838095.1 uncharacterized protein LOC108596641 [Drosophila busckii]XP_017838096.1 uncharacterized protein LOC108596641 [Drosophila busckii]XP_017838097.1 uncharacterized protein LOC108596641 [Drosophila busckii]XP_017838098.1 uncharacterized protein LOC108596641 [Drosophila busckii]XP_017838099.1 uncharacterized protein LOC108596641 [Drosophila busckii]ALC4